MLKCYSFLLERLFSWGLWRKVLFLYQWRFNFSAFVQCQLLEKYYFFNLNLIANEKNNNLFLDDIVRKSIAFVLLLVSQSICYIWHRKQPREERLFKFNPHSTDHFIIKSSILNSECHNYNYSMDCDTFII